MRPQVALLAALCLCALTSLAVAQNLHFSARQDIQTSATHLTGLVLADFNGDHKLDIAVTDDYSQTVSVYLNDGNGNFGAPVTSTFTVPSIGGFGAIVAGDVNEDGKQDLIVGPVAGLQYDVVLLGNGDGTFTEKGQITTSYGFIGVALVDINGDKHLDLVAGGNGALSVFLGDGTGNFTQQPLPNYPGGDFYPAIAVGNFNNDKALDFVAASYRSNQLLYFPGNGDGSFGQSSALTVRNLMSPYSLASADFNGDGKLDLIAGFDDVASLIFGNGDGTFQTAGARALPLPAPTNRAPGIVPLVAATDMNGDGKIDVVVTDDGSDTLNVFLNDGFANFASPLTEALEDGTGSIQLADLNGDGLPDVVLINYKTQKISLILSVGTTLKTTPTVSIQSSAAQALMGTFVSITVQVKPLGSHVPTGAVTLTSGTTSFGQQTLNSSGQASFTLPVLGVGQYPLTASYAGDTYNNGASNTSPFIQDSTDFQFALSSPTQTVGIGASASYGFTLTPEAGFTGQITLSCSGLPAGYTCSAQTIPLDTQAVNAAVVVSPPVSKSASPIQPLRHSAAATFLALSGICFCLRRKRINQLLVCLAAFIALSFTSGCSGGSSGSKRSGYIGTSTFTITATTSQGLVTLADEATATLIVQ